MKKLLLLAGAVILWQIAEAKKFLKNVKVKFLDGKFDYKSTEASGFQKIYFRIRVSVGNNTQLATTLQSAKVALYWDKKKLGFVDLKKAVSIQAGKDVVVEIPVQVQTINLIRSIPELLQVIGNNKALVFHVTGPLNFNAGTYTVDQDIKVPLLNG